MGLNNLVVFSRKHAQDLIDYIGAEVRPSPENITWAMVNRLPTWMKLARNRETVLKALNRVLARMDGVC